MRKNPPAALFVLLVWMIFLVLFARDAYDKLMKVQVPTSTRPKSMEELFNGDP